MKLYKTKSGILAEHEQQYYLVNENWDQLVNRNNLYEYLTEVTKRSKTILHGPTLIQNELLPPIGEQEVWAAGVTYLRSKTARMEESKDSGGGSFYDKVYDADRPELFFKASPGRVVGTGDIVHIRKDSTWNTPEPELTLFMNEFGNIEGYTIGNDMSSRNIEGENPLYLPQAKVYERSAALGPCLLVLKKPIAANTVINMRIERGGKEMYNDSVPISQMKRTHTELAHYLFKESVFPRGCYLMTGTCLVPPSDFSLQEKDEIFITIETIGLLHNIVGTKK